MQNKRRGIALIALAGLSLLSLVVAQSYMIFIATNSIGGADKIDGYVGLRQYFDSGTGTEDDPYVITRPNHLYNLSRLQNLGAFPTSKYFQLGKHPTAPAEDVDKFLMYGDDTSTTLNKTSLNMTNYKTKMLSIGTTATPFFGKFNGNDLIIDNLTIVSDPEDIGVFGYVASNASVTNTIFSNLEITDKGYNNALSQFYSTSNLAAISSMDSLLTLNTSPISSTPSTYTIDVSSSDSYVLQMDSSLIKNSEDIISDDNVNFSADGNVTYSIRSTNSDLFVVSDNNSKMTINLGLLNENTEFKSKTCSVYSRVYLTGSVVKNNARYAKILGTYTITISNDIGTNEQYITLVKDPDDTYSYTHNTNIGFVAGHSDGSIQSCYVYKGSFDLNQSNASYTSQAAESEIGLVGEVGININNSISPTINYEAAGDTGVINFTNIYKNIRGVDNNGLPSTAASDQQNALNSDNVTKYFYYFTPATTNLYGEYLRTRRVGDKDEDLTATVNSVDFKGRQAIVENDSNSRGLGIFQLNTADADTTDNTNQFLNGLGEFAIKYDSSRTFSSIFYTTAELDATLGGTTTPSAYFGSNKVTYWKTYGDRSSTDNDYARDSFHINTGTTIPSGTFLSSFNSEIEVPSMSSTAFERNNNYLIKVTLDNLATNYFSGTNSGFLRDYFTYKLRDKKNNKIPYRSSDFGVMVKEFVNGSYTNTTSFSSYLELDANVDSNGYAQKITYTDKNNQQAEGPAKAIQFSVKNDNGANVTVIASNQNTDNDYVCIYDMKYIDEKNSYLHPSYAMYLPYNKTEDELIEHTSPYFDYDNSAKNFVSRNATIPADGISETRLYAHTFYIPKGDYYIGSPDNLAKIYYVAAQGQEGQGNLGDRTPIYINADVIENLDFLLYDPTAVGFTIADSRAYAAFMAKFNSSAGTLTIDVNESNELTITSTSCLTSALIQNTTNKNIVFNGETYNTSYIKYNYN